MKKIIFMLCLMISRAILAAPTEVYFEIIVDGGVNKLRHKVGAGGSWTVEANASAATFDTKLGTYVGNNWANGLMCNLIGTGFETDGIVAPVWSLNNYPFLGIKGQGMTSTTLKLKNGATYYPATGFQYVVSPEGWLINYYLGNLTLDCNWAGQATTVTYPGDWPGDWCKNTTDVKTSTNYQCSYKLGGSSVRCYYATNEYVKVINSGANSKCTVATATNGCTELPGGGTESFLLELRTSNLGQSDTPLVIRNCEVNAFTRVKNGYCTAINVVTHELSSPAIGSRTNRLALVHNNTVYGIDDGIAFGLPSSERIDFLYNQVLYCKAAFNCDTGPGWNINIISNTFDSVNVGINIGYPGAPSNNDKYWDISYNDIYLKGRYYNAYLGPAETNCYAPTLYWEPAWGVRISGGTSNINIHHNDFSSWDHFVFAPTGTPSEQKYYCIWKPSCVSDAAPSYSNNTASGNVYNTLLSAP